MNYMWKTLKLRFLQSHEKIGLFYTFEAICQG